MGAATNQQALRDLSDRCVRQSDDTLVTPADGIDASGAVACQAPIGGEESLLQAIATATTLTVGGTAHVHLTAWPCSGCDTKALALEVTPSEGSVLTVTIAGKLASGDTDYASDSLITSAGALVSLTPITTSGTTIRRYIIDLTPYNAPLLCVTITATVANAVINSAYFWGRAGA